MTMAFLSNNLSVNTNNRAISANCTFKGNILNDFDLTNTKSENDVFELQTTQKTEPPKIKYIRLFFNRLRKDQINEINESGQLPKNAKFVDNGRVRLTWNLINFTAGTHKLPKGYELKNDILGFTHVVREETKAWYLKENNPE